MIHFLSVLNKINGRLKHSNLDYNQKYPFILRNDSVFVKLLVLDRHLKMLHGGIQLTLSVIRQYLIGL